MRRTYCYPFETGSSYLVPTNQLDEVGMNISQNPSDRLCRAFHEQIIQPLHLVHYSRICNDTKLQSRHPIRVISTQRSLQRGHSPSQSRFPLNGHGQL